MFSCSGEFSPSSTVRSLSSTQTEGRSDYVIYNLSNCALDLITDSIMIVNRTFDKFYRDSNLLSQRTCNKMEGQVFSYVGRGGENLITQIQTGKGRQFPSQIIVGWHIHLFSHSFQSTSIFLVPFAFLFLISPAFNSLLQFLFLPVCLFLHSHSWSHLVLKSRSNVISIIVINSTGKSKGQVSKLLFHVLSQKFREDLQFSVPFLRNKLFLYSDLLLSKNSQDWAKETKLTNSETMQGTVNCINALDHNDPSILTVRDWSVQYFYQCYYIM